MTLTPGTRLGPYEILSALGAGGMGEVYRARDTKLGRDVAIKVVLDAFAAEPERVARFQREAQILATLNHPHIGAIYGLEQADSSHFLVLELVEGETLADRLRRGPLPVEAVLHVGQQIAAALEAAHEKGVVHRDLKPANVKITPDEQVKVLDFGLAKAVEPSSAASNASPTAAGLTHSPTLSVMATQAGMILGTAAYMSPEQAKGLSADHRSDVFSFGVVFYEMLTGRQPFQGETAPDVLASVLVREPDLGAVPPNLNPRIVDMLKRCLDKNPKKRWQAVGDLRAEIETIAAAPAVAVPVSAAAVVGRQPLWRRAIPIAAAVLLTAAATTAAARYFRPSVVSPVVRFTVPLPDGRTFTNLNRQSITMSPDGSLLAFVAGNSAFVRAVGESSAKLIGDNVASSIVFSPDGKSLAFWNGGLLRRTAVTGGAPITIATVDPPTGLSWDDDAIVLGQGAKGVVRVPANGGQPQLIAAAKPDELVQSPQMLPDGDTLLFTLAKNQGGVGAWDTAKIVAQSIKTGNRTVLVDAGSNGRYLPTGHLVYAVSGVLFAVPFDLSRLKVTGNPVPVVEGVRRSVNNNGTAHFAISSNGSLAYIPGPRNVGAGNENIVLEERNGPAMPLKLPASAYDALRVSPDGKRLAFHSDNGSGSDVWIYDLSATNGLRRLTFAGKNWNPTWSPDGERIVFQSDRDGDSALFVQAADGSGTAERLTKPDAGTSHVPESWSPDGRHILFAVLKGSSYSLWSVSVQDKKAESFGGVVSTNPTTATFSPDGRWVAYTMSEARHVVYVQPFPATGAKHQISKDDDGHHPVWAPDGMAIFFLPGPSPQFATVKVTTNPSFAIGNVQPLTRHFTQHTAPARQRSYDVTKTGQFVGVGLAGADEGASAERIEVVLNWSEELKTRVPSK